MNEVKNMDSELDDVNGISTHKDVLNTVIKLSIVLSLLYCALLSSMVGMYRFFGPDWGVSPDVAWIMFSLVGTSFVWAILCWSVRVYVWHNVDLGCDLFRQGRIMGVLSFFHLGGLSFNAPFNVELERAVKDKGQQNRIYRALGLDRSITIYADIGMLMIFAFYFFKLLPSMVW